MQNQEIVQIIENLKGRKNYEEKKASKLGFKSLYAYYEDKISKKKQAVDQQKKDCEELTIDKQFSKDEEKIKKKSCSCC